MLHEQYRSHRLQTIEAATVRCHAVILKGFLQYCEDQEFITVNPLRKSKFPKPARRPKYCPTLQDINDLLQASSPEFARQLATLCFTGMRVGELQMLRPRDVDLQGSWIQILSRGEWRTKTGASRRVPIHPRLLPYLQAAMKVAGGKPYLFCAPASRLFPKGDHPINPRKVLLEFQRLAKEVGLRVGHKDQGAVVHSLRHFVESFCINNNIPQRVVDAWLGHSGGGGTGRLYYHLSDSESQAFMARVPFDGQTNLQLPQKGLNNIA